jgi:hypothetical protein
MAVIPIGNALFKAVWSGTLGATTEEIFSYQRFCYADASATPGAVLTTLQGDVAAMLAESTTGSTPFSNLGQVFPTTVLWTQLKVSKWDPLLDQLIGDPAVAALTDAGLGASSQGLPYQDALAITTQAAPPDRKHRSRFYLPPFVSTATDGHGRVLPTLVDDFQTVLKLSDHANQVATTPVTFCIYSGTTLLAYQVERYYTGDVMDTIRRRRNKLPEVRHILAA